MSLLILTVGTGTAGRHSSLADGLRNTISLLQPRLFWLVPSESPDSLAIADLVREGFDSFQPWAEGVPYRAIARHDSLADCRDTVRGVIAVARRHLREGESLLLNPTSGTKQMSAGATVAALDESLGEIVFTVGDRSEGVVVTGTERIERFDASDYHAARDAGIARELAAAGNPLAAADLFSRHPALSGDAAVARCLHEWSRLNYEGARKIAAQSPDPRLIAVRGHLQTLALALRPNSEPSLLVASDLLQNAEALVACGDCETAFFHTCKALEIALRNALWQNTQLLEPFRLKDLLALTSRKELQDRYRATALADGTCRLGLRQVAELLGSLNDPLCDALFRERAFDFVSIRNELAHAIRPVSMKEAASFISLVQRLFRDRLPTCPPRPDLFTKVPVERDVPAR